MTHVIAQPCVGVKDRACVAECPVDCIYEGARMLYIHPDECVDYGVCEPVCPVEAISYEDDTHALWSAFQGANREFFDELGTPGGVSSVGVIPRDAPMVAELPPNAGAPSKMLLAEFDYTMQPAPSLPLIDTTHQRRDMWYLKRYGLPAMYWNLILTGRAQGLPC